MTYAITHRRGPSAISRPAKSGAGGYACRRIFDNSQLIERFGKWLVICGHAENTRVNYTVAARQFAKFLVDKPLTAATKEDVRAFIGSLYTKGLAATTIQARLDALRTLGDCLQLGSQVRASVPRYILRRKLPKHLPKALSEEQIERLFAAATAPRDRAILELLYAAGLRVSELASLRIEDVDLHGRSLTVRCGKGGKDRIALFGRPAARALREYLGERDRGFVFLSEGRQQRGGVSRHHGVWWGFYRDYREPPVNGKRIQRQVRLGDYELPTKERARQALDAYLAGKRVALARPKRDTALCVRQTRRVVADTAKRAGLGRVHPHQLRHSFATHCLNHGMDIRFVQELLGHSSLVATQKYLHLATANLQRVHAQFHPRG
jgi:site-specific recombinase XerD